MSGLLLPLKVQLEHQRNLEAKGVKVDHCIITAMDTVTGVLYQNTYAISEEEIIDHVEQVVHTQEKQVMDMLILLGWTPPVEDKRSR